ncbi:hypothetical protein LZ32DRAFT_593364 [Colletotrichum eremochloae]|nr:hypothetical protein LZ32DRAFT_593364 [Colletotrichum eremochloae]
MANTVRCFVSGSVYSLFLSFLLHVLLINASPTAVVLTERNGPSFPTFPQNLQGRIQKGQYLKKLFPLNEQTATLFNGGKTVASPFKDPSALKLNGWTRYIYWFPYTKNTGDPEPRLKWPDPVVPPGYRLSVSPTPTYGPELDEAFADKRHPVDQTKGASYTYRHDKKFGPKKEKATFSSYSNVLVPASGAFIFDLDSSPKFSKEAWNLGNVPELQKVSDIAFFQWIDACRAKNVDPKALKLMFISHVANYETYSLVKDVLFYTGYTRVPPFAEKIVFSMESLQGQAILGSVWGSALSFMLIQHKKELGLKKITEVAIWGLRNGFNLPTNDELVGTMEMRFIVEDA